MKTNTDNNRNEKKQLNKYFELSACALLFGVAMIIIGVFL